MSRETRSKQAADEAAKAAYRKELIAGHIKSSRDADRTITTLSASALGLSLLILRDLGIAPSHTCLIIIGWSSLTLALALMVISMLVSSASYRQILDRLAHAPSLEEMDPLPKSAQWTTGLTWASGCALILGTTFVFLFTALNI